MVAAVVVVVGGNDNQHLTTVINHVSGFCLLKYIVRYIIEFITLYDTA